MKTPSLRDRALKWLAQREHSSAELRRKLARYADDPDAIASLLDELVQRKLVSDDRYAEARAHTLARKFGVARIEGALRASGVSDTTIVRTTTAMRATEAVRAQAAWQKRFGVLPATAAERARQIRFLQARGFSYDVIRRILRGLADDD